MTPQTKGVDSTNTPHKRHTRPTALNEFMNTLGAVENLEITIEIELLHGILNYTKH